MLLLVNESFKFDGPKNSRCGRHNLINFNGIESLVISETASPLIQISNLLCLQYPGFVSQCLY
jgi:hypothetical protein